MLRRLFLQNNQMQFSVVLSLSMQGPSWAYAAGRMECVNRRSNWAPEWFRSPNTVATEAFDRRRFMAMSPLETFQHTHASRVPVQDGRT
jgi:hypothetical protein